MTIRAQWGGLAVRCGRGILDRRPERSRAQIEAFMRRAAAAGTLAIPDPRLAAEQLIALARGEIHLRSLLRLEDPGNPAALPTAATRAVATFLRAFLR